MQYDDERWRAQSHGTTEQQTDGYRCSLSSLTELLHEILDSGRQAAELYPELLQRCRRQGISERRLWYGLALWRQTGNPDCPELPWPDLTLASREKLKLRTFSLIGELPAESLDEFRGLVALTATLLDRVQFVCDLVVYLYAERQKGRWTGSEGRLYTQFFTDKLMWELEVMRQLGEQHPLGQLAEEYGSWLCERILDGEVLT